MKPENYSLLFWQSRVDYLRLLSSFKFGRILLVFLNYAIWLFFFYLSYLLVKFDANIFWQLLLATILAELIEKIFKRKNLWPRPMFLRHDQTPLGLVDSWYRSGSFPSGHSIKAAFFFLFLLQYHVFPLPLFFAVVVPLILFRVLVSFHYPIDILGGILIGILIWLPLHLLTFPLFLLNLTRVIFNFVFHLA